MFLCDLFQRGGEVKNTTRLIQQGAKMTSLTFISQIEDNCSAVFVFFFFPDMKLGCVGSRFNWAKAIVYRVRIQLEQKPRRI